MTTIIKERLKALDSITLQRGAHDPNGDKQFSAMEAAAWIAGEEHSGHPKCVSPVLAAFMRALNDALDDEARQALKPYIPRVIGTAGDGHDEERSWMAVDWLARVCAPAWLGLAGINDSAEALRSLPPITEATLAEAQPTVEAARKKAAAAWAAAGGAARDAVWDAAWVAALEAEKQGGGSGAIKECFAPVKAELHRSAHHLLDCMIDGSERKLHDLRPDLASGRGLPERGEARRVRKAGRRIRRTPEGRA